MRGSPVNYVVPLHLMLILVDSACAAHAVMRKLKTVKNVTRSVASIVEIRVRTAMNVFVKTAGTTRCLQ